MPIKSETREQRTEERWVAIQELLPVRVRERVTVVVREGAMGLTSVRIRVKMKYVPDPGGAASHSVAKRT